MDSDGSGPPSRRESHYSHQRSSLSSSLASPRPQSADASTKKPKRFSPVIGNLENLTDISGPPPADNAKEGKLHKHKTLQGDGRRKQGSVGSIPDRRLRRALSFGHDEPAQSPTIPYAYPEQYDNLNELVSRLPADNPDESRLYRRDVPEEGRARSASRSSRAARKSLRPATGRGSVFSGLPEESLTALPSAGQVLDKTVLQEELGMADSWRSNLGATAPPPDRAISRIATELYTVSYLILFSILGTLARLGLQWLTFYPGAPVVTGVLWANFAGSLVMGFLSEDRRLFREEWGSPSSAETIFNSQNRTDEEGVEKANYARKEHSRIKKTIPLYIGLATGFCGSFTSFSSFMRDAFFALSNNLPAPISHPYPTGFTPPSTTTTIHRNGGYSFMAVCAVIILTLALSLSALKVGAHLAISLDPWTPSLPFRFIRKFLDRLCVFLGFGCWFGAVILAIWPPDRPGGPSSHDTWAQETWRGQAIFACVFAPLGTLLRFYASLKLNGISPSFPLGTFAVNIFGTAVLGMAYDLQHVRLGDDLVGGGRTSCQVLQGIMDGFDGCLTTVSTFVAELAMLRRRQAYMYALVSVSVGLGVLVVVMGSVRWSVGWSPAVCV